MFFTVEMLRKDCKEKFQSQSFSGAGAQDQNAQAKRAIKTIMHMVSSFIALLDGMRCQ